MELPPDIKQRFREFGRAGGTIRAAKISPERRRAIARKAAFSRWTRARFGSPSYAALGLPGGDLVDAGLEDLANGKVSLASLLVSLAAPRLRREGVPVTVTDDDPEHRLYAMLSQSEGDLAHARYNAYRQRIVSFANACSSARID